jgi:hypothetical protein
MPAPLVDRPSRLPDKEIFKYIQGIFKEYSDNIQYVGSYRT